MFNLFTDPEHISLIVPIAYNVTRFPANGNILHDNGRHLYPIILGVPILMTIETHDGKATQGGEALTEREKKRERKIEKTSYFAGPGTRGGFRHPTSIDFNTDGKNPEYDATFP
ncbi:hypothetical protein N7505_009220 [Penicillium chrysogenum]|uniref:Uncharacterized protein n=1 Tax=Penicillium chrysogenum TaxID=5076 RepID=A0ABQ8W7E4_PENCH|nr:hypothetical protein N7505_009220 [Penicillium chrysogenum]